MSIVILAAVAAGGLAENREAHATCYVCLHKCCLRTHRGGYRGCTETRDDATGRCIGCAVDEGRPCLLPAGCEDELECTVELNESSAYDEPELAECDGREFAPDDYSDE